MILTIAYLLIGAYCTYRFHPTVKTELCDSDYKRNQKEAEIFVDEFMAWIVAGLGGLFWPLILFMRVIYLWKYKGKKSSGL